MTQTNTYYKDNPVLFMQLKELVDKYPRSYFRMLFRNGKYCKHSKLCYNPDKDRSHLLNWINSSLPLLADPQYSITTKCYWILNGLTDFPICRHCKKNDRYIGKNVGKDGYFEYCSTKCMANSAEVKQKKTQTNNERYQSDYFMGTEKFISMSKATRLKEHQNENWVNVEKSRKTRYDKNNGKWVSDEQRAKTEKTVLEKYGVTNVFAADSVKQTIQQTMLEKYGVKCNMQCPSIFKKGQQTKIEKYGSAYPSFSFKYDDKLFDSIPELSFYIWLKDNNIDFQFHSGFFIEYTYENKARKYFPDFIVENQLVEIKGDMFFLDHDPTNKMICPWDRTQDALYEAKHQCMTDNNVLILTSAQYNQFVDYCNCKFGQNDWHKKYRFKKGEFTI